jgi:hypothetical protein
MRNIRSVYTPSYQGKKLKATTILQKIYNPVPKPSKIKKKASSVKQDLQLRLTDFSTNKEAVSTVYLFIQLYCRGKEFY